ncbi:MAG TPA: hypothetical protein VMQ56_14190 [Terracidiphilus sp.]|jgi:hypothetical protein|nr:hypothetical protein [Terracidiphilus sp.]
MMHLAFRPVFGTFLSCIAVVALPFPLVAQPDGASIAAIAAAPLPEAPQPLIAPDAIDHSDQQGSSQQDPAQAPGAQGSSSSQAPAQLSDAEKSEHEKAEEQLKAEEHQRVMGVMAAFNTTSNRDALPLSAGQKFKLFFKSSTDPWPFLLAGAVSGIGMANDSYPTWGQGAQGYAKRYGAAYSDAFIGNFFGNAVFTSWWHEDPRYFQKGTGSGVKRFLWAAGSTVWCKRDSGKWGPNYANVIGNLVGAAISNVYYPASEHTVSNTINDGLSVSAEGIVGAEVIEFWPDIVRHHKRKQAEKLARQAGQGDAGSAPKAPPQDAPKQ